ncbi:MAG TPA: hypothetical protein DCZ75_11610 [Geobacter sp.]|nr:hypothetical protein [Geobacter sp.]
MQEGWYCAKLAPMNPKSSQAPNTTIDPSINEYRKHLWDALRAGQEQYDKYLLTLSSGGLAISLMMLKEVFGKTPLACPTVLIWSWVLFCLCIVSTIISFLTSQKCLRRHLEKYEAYVATGNDENLKKLDPLERLTNYLNHASGVFLVLAITATIIFASTNLQKGAFMPNYPTDNGQRGYTPPQMPTVNPGAGYTPPQAPTQHAPTPPPPAPPQPK